MSGQPTTFLRADRLPWTEAPAEVRDWVGARAGEPIAGWSDRSGGMSTGLAAVVHGDKRSVFVKAVDADHNPSGAKMYRREAEFAARLASLPAVPAPLDAGEVTAASGGVWVLLLFDALPGEPPDHPWRPDHLARTLDAWTEVREALAGIDGLPHRAMLAGLFDGWRQSAADSDAPLHQLATDWTEREVRLLERIEPENDRI
ncbi:MAG: phosphotransferase, partial [Stackebrandtia sp.]